MPDTTLGTVMSTLDKPSTWKSLAWPSVPGPPPAPGPGSTRPPHCRRHTLLQEIEVVWDLWLAGHMLGQGVKYLMLILHILQGLIKQARYLNIERN